MGTTTFRSFGSRLLRRAAIGILLLLALGLGYWLHGSTAPPPLATEIQEQPSSAEAILWTCSMHPQVRQPKPGKCPICFMDLIPVTKTSAAMSTGAASYVMSEAARELLHVETAPVERKFVTAEVRMVGKVDYDETRLAYIAAWVPGRLDRLYADYTGIQVQKGDHLVDLYSPELLTAKEEFRRAAQALSKLPENAPAVLKETAQSTLTAARSKMMRWGLSAKQVDDALTGAGGGDTITIFAPIGGTVISRTGQEGMYVETGSPIYTIADLSVVWVKLDAYESDLPWIHYGQTVQFTSEAYPGKQFEGRIAFIDPMLDAMTRTVKVRVNVPNKDGLLKPGMFVRAMVHSQVATGGRVMDPGLAGKWISPMHPEVVRDGPGPCPVCGMPLVRAEELGYVPAAATAQDKPLVISASAPLITGKRAVVYVETPNAAEPAFEGREIVLGPRAGDYYLVESGLREGERVVTQGNFKIDSALQIEARPSMMNASEAAPAKPPAEREAIPEAFRTQLAGLYDAYLTAQTALAGDDAAAALEGVRQARAVLERFDLSALQPPAAEMWTKMHANALAGPMKDLEAAKDIEAARAAFQPWSDALIAVVKHYGLPEATVAYRLHCPMAFDFKGADWLQSGEEVLNPYFGKKMLRCGTLEEQISGKKDASHE